MLPIVAQAQKKDREDKKRRRNWPVCLKNETGEISFQNLRTFPK